MDKINSQSPLARYWPYLSNGVLLILVIALLGLKGCNTVISRDPETLPENAQLCLVAEGGFSCEDGMLNGHTFLLSGVPEGIKPVILPIGADAESKLLGLPKDGFQCLISIAGNLAFYDGNDKLVTSFASPITLSFEYTGNDLEALSTCSSGPTEEDLIPVYLYLPMVDSRVNIWKPFQNYEIDLETNVISVQFRFWGDPQSGIGTR